MTEMRVHRKQILQTKVPDQPLLPDDILAVPYSSGRALARLQPGRGAAGGTLPSVAAMP